MKYLCILVLALGCSSSPSESTQDAETDSGPEVPIVVKYCREASLDGNCKPPPVYGTYPSLAFLPCAASNPASQPLPFALYPTDRVLNPSPSRYCFVQNEAMGWYCCTP